MNTSHAQTQQPATKPAHTPTPWAADEAESGGSRILSTVNGANIAFTDYLNDASLKEPREDFANAQLIVRAVNAHDELVNALGLLVAFVDSDDEEGPAIGEVIEQARAALAKAKGTP